MTNPNLKDLTHDSHHSAQDTTLGRAIMNNTITHKQYLSWLYLQSGIHASIDAFFPTCCHRYAEINLDILELLSSGMLSPEEKEEAILLVDKNKSFIVEFLDSYEFDDSTYLENAYAAGYIMLGAHLMGGPKNKKHLENSGFIANHLEFKDGQRQEAREVLFRLRNMPYLADRANNFFGLVRDLMDKIE
jgi:hypothetical protein